jgi:hypothetical protein
VTFLPGLELCRRFHDEAVRPILAARFPGLRYAAARIGPGSDVLGFDTPRSMDHDWGPRLLIFLDPQDAGAGGGAGAPGGGATAGQVDAALAATLPATFLGLPARYRAGGQTAFGVLDPAGGRHGCTVTTLDRWFADQLGFDPRTPGTGPTTFDWLATPTQRLAEVTGGAVFHDGTGELTAARRRLRWYPDDVWRYVLACQWTRVGQEEHLAGRAAEAGDALGSAVLAARIARDLARLALLLARTWAPYGKWLGTALARAPGGAALGAHLAAAVTAPDWPAREERLCRAYELLAKATNATGLAPPVDPRVRRFHDRPFRVLDAGRFAAALTAAITDPALRGLPPVGAVDQYLDSTDVLCHPARTRAAAGALTPVEP